MQPAAERVALAAILLAGLVLRAIHVDWGLPGYVFWDSHLHFIGPAAALVAEGDFALSKAQFVHGPVLPYLLGAVYAAWSLASGSEIAKSGPALAAQLPELVLVARALALAIAVASIAVLHLLARRLLGARAALLAASAFALAPIHVLESHRINPNGAMMLLTLLSSYVAVVAWERRDARRLMAAFALAGLAGAVKYVGPFAGAVPAWLALTWPDAPRGRRLGLLAGGALAALAALAFGLVPALLHVDRLVATIALFANVGFVVGAPGYGVPGTGPADNRLVYALLVAPPYLMGWPLYLASLAGLLVIWRRARFAFGVAVAFLLPYFAMQAAAALVVARYFEPLLPHLALCAGAALSALWSWRRGAGPALVALVLGYTLALSASQVARLGGATQDGAARHLGALSERAAASGGRLVVGYWGRWTWSYDTLRPLLAPLDLDVVQIPPAYQGEVPEAELPRGEDAWLELDRRWVSENGVDVVVLPSWAEHHFAREGADHPQARFYRRLAGPLGFRLAAHYESRFLTQALYAWGDPMLNGHWETGIAGYKILVRDGLFDEGARRDAKP